MSSVFLYRHPTLVFFLNRDALLLMFQIIIEGTRGNGYLGDIAIDDICLTEGDCNRVNGSSLTPVSCKKVSLCFWKPQKSTNNIRI